MPFIDFYTGAWTNEQTAIKQIVDCAVLTIPGEWGFADAQFGTQLLPKQWRGNLDSSVAETLVRNTLERYKDWFILEFVRFRIEPPDDGNDITSFSVDVTARIVETMEPVIHVVELGSSQPVIP